MSVVTLLSLIVFRRIFLRLPIGYTGAIANELSCFSCKCILASTGVQQGDPLSPLLFSLVLLQFLGSVSFSETCLLSLWYLDDGTFIKELDYLSMSYFPFLLSWP